VRDNQVFESINLFSAAGRERAPLLSARAVVPGAAVLGIIIKVESLLIGRREALCAQICMLSAAGIMNNPWSGSPANVKGQSKAELCT
jgi:hypothetical protein